VSDRLRREQQLLFNQHVILERLMMDYFRKFRTFAFLALGALGLAACNTTTQLAPEAAAADQAITPVNVDQLIAGYVASNPGATEVPLHNIRRRGWTLYTDGTMSFHGFTSTSRLNYRTAVTESSGNRICQAPTDFWSGVCLTLYRLGDGSIRVEYEFGNGAKSSYVARSISI